MGGYPYVPLDHFTEQFLYGMSCLRDERERKMNMSFLKKRNRRLDFCSFLKKSKGSLTVEAAVVLPVFLLAMTMLVGVVDLCRVKIEAQAKLTQKAKTLSLYAYGCSEIYENGYVDLYKNEEYKLPVQLFPIKDIKLAVRARVHTWTGRDGMTAKGDSDVTNKAETMVYVTDRETVYHSDSGCTHLQLAILQTNKNDLISQKNVNGQSYHACEKCCKGALNGNAFYITKQGDSYHASLNCGSLIRTVKLVRKEDVGGLKECERCSQKHQNGS